MEEPELRAALTNLDNLLNRYGDEKGNLFPFKTFLKNFIRLRTKRITLPTSEVMAIIKRERPIIYGALKNTNDTTFHFLTNIEMDYEKARKKLDDIRKEI